MKVGLKIWFTNGYTVYKGQVTNVYNGRFSTECEITWSLGISQVCGGYTEKEFWERFKIDETQMAEDLLRKYENAEEA